MTRAGGAAGRSAKEKDPRRGPFRPTACRKRASEPGAGDASQSVAADTENDGQRTRADRARFAVGADHAEPGVPGHAAIGRYGEESGSEDEPDSVAACDCARDEAWDGGVVLDRAGGDLGRGLQRDAHPEGRVVADHRVPDGDGRSVERENAALRGRVAVAADGV